MSYFSNLQEQIKGEANKYEVNAYRLEKTIEFLRIELRVLKNELVEEETIGKFLYFANTHMQSSIKFSIQTSFRELLENLERYYAVLPLPYLDQEIVNLIPEYIIEKRVAQREYFGLEKENVINFLIF